VAALVLVADDEEKIARLVGSYLEASGFRVAYAPDGARALALFKELLPDCVVLDISMPVMDGLAAAREIRKESEAPIIFLSARAEETDRIVGLELGADDYVVKPFSPRELVARVRARLRRPAGRSAAAASPAIRAGDLEIDVKKRAVRAAGRSIALTTAQFDILAMLAREPGRVFTRLEILEGASGTAYEGYERTIDAQVKNIRKALGDDSAEPRYLGTVRGIGYRFIESAREP
jgi:DNA-binding response OmpR family regulator